jgi:hypothetical protein
VFAQPTSLDLASESAPFAQPQGGGEPWRPLAFQ